ncbi:MULTISPECIES: hypothetical protein [Niastella]|uniref:Uncharacterized protein n=1 Tax=Niastella soli TaxID=2821487 RepID=A0ABS3YXP8_9BACT|nr:hypothetical protein [Niastella soli]MBO9202638.1 hypothetical protein [Niastella soli]
MRFYAAIVYVGCMVLAVWLQELTRGEVDTLMGVKGLIGVIGEGSW